MRCGASLLPEAVQRFQEVIRHMIVGRGRVRMMLSTGVTGVMRRSLLLHGSLLPRLSRRLILLTTVQMWHPVRIASTRLHLLFLLLTLMILSVPIREMMIHTR